MPRSGKAPNNRMAAQGRRAVFLDRDGVLNEARVGAGKPYPPQTVADFVLLPEVAEACRLLKDAGFLLIVATNQPDVGRGAQSREVVEEMHRIMRAALPIDHVEVCWHAGRGEICACRKPAPGMLVHAAGLLEVDLPRSYMVGDRWRDIDCGSAAGCATVFIDRGYDEALRVQPDFQAADLLAAAQIILQNG
jgi:D-glycero-D-manno-heptose 1,7-bisphosphate phosphatase